MAKRKGKMPAGLARYWAKKRGKKRAAKKAGKRRAKRTPRVHGPTRRTLRRDVKAHHSRQVKTAKALIQEELKTMRLKLSLLGKGLSGRAGRRK